MEVGQAAVMAVVGSHLVAGRVAQHEDVLDVLLADRLPRRLGEDLHHHLDVFGADVPVRRARELVDLRGEGLLVASAVDAALFDLLDEEAELAELELAVRVVVDLLDDLLELLLLRLIPELLHQHLQLVDIDRAVAVAVE